MSYKIPSGQLKNLCSGIQFNLFLSENNYQIIIKIIIKIPYEILRRHKIL